MGSIRVYVYPVARASDTGWKVQWRENRHQASSTFDTEQEADDFAAIKKGELVSGKGFDAQPGKIAFRTYWEDGYLPHYLSRTNRSPKTKASYEGYYRRLLEPYFGERSLNDIRKATLKDWVRWCEKGAGRKYMPSAHSVKEAFVVLRSVLTRAVNDELIQVNPCTRMGDILPDLPPKRKPVVLSLPEIRALSGALDPHYTALVLLLGTHGLRPSEALALTVSDVHLKEGYVWVDKAVVNVNGKMTAKPNTKNMEPRRVELFSFTKEALMEHMATLGSLGDDTLLFPGKLSGSVCTQEGPRKGKVYGPYMHMDYLRKIVNEAGEKLGFKGLTTYDLKRSAATNLLTLTGNIKWVQEQLGHSRYSMSLLYAQVTKGMSAAADEIMTAAFEGEEDDQDEDETEPKKKAS